MTTWVRSFLAFGLLLTLVLGCGDSTGRLDGSSSKYPDYGGTVYRDRGTGVACSSANCSGCCGNNHCKQGGTSQACGYGGNMCQACITGQSCQGGVCITSKCDSTTCKSGCCDSSKVCKNGTADTACGTAGASCSACKSSEVCTSYKCQPKSSALYKVILEKLVKEKAFTCDSWPGGECDFYLEVEVGPIKATSTTKANTDNPVWNEVLATATAQQITKKLYAKVYDDDWPVDQYVGECKPSVSNADIAKGSLSVECGVSSSMGFTRRCTVYFKFTPVGS